MEKLKERITENGIDYILVGDYYIPDLKLPEENRPIGRYGRLHGNISNRNTRHGTAPLSLQGNCGHTLPT
ncbi:TnpV protein [Sporofaciens musculi]|uniref:TnpV protein n=1 Tax=Sporofaciens musculi TaxID=2681861 RepID=UPI001FCC65EA|nr:TnpV protein [Sporofaciens musculi]